MGVADSEASLSLVRSVLPRYRLGALLLLWLLPAAEYMLFAPLFSDPETGLFPLTFMLALVVLGAGAALVAHRILRKAAGAAVRLQELGLFALGGVSALVALTLYSASASKGPLSWAMAGAVSFLLLLLASTLHSRLMEGRAAFAAPLVAGLLWPLLVPFREMAETIGHLTPWVFDGLTLSVMAALMLLAILAIHVLATIPVGGRYLAAWAAAVLMMAAVPFHEVLGLFSNQAYGSVDRSLSLAGLLLGIAAIAVFLRQNHRANLLRRELDKGDELHREGLHLEAVRHYDNALRIDGELAHAWTRKELALRAAGADEEAKKALREVLRIQPDSEGALNEMGVLLRRQGKFREALEHFERTLARNPGFVVAWNNKGNTLQNLHQVREAVKCYDKALELNPRFEAAWVNKARALASLGRFRAALEAMDRALGLRPDSEAGWNEKGLIYMKMARHAEALAHFEKALKLNPRFEAAWNNKGNALLKLGRTAEAMRCYNRALQLNVDYYAAWYNEGSALIDTGDIVGALRCLDEAIKLNPASDVAWNERGVALRKLGKLQDAEEHFKRAIQLNPGYVAAWNNRGNSLMDQGRTDEAYHCYNVATMMDPKYDKAWYNKGCALLALGKAEEAMGAFERSVGASLQAVIDADKLLKEVSGPADLPAPAPEAPAPSSAPASTDERPAAKAGGLSSDEGAGPGREAGST